MEIFYEMSEKIKSEKRAFKFMNRKKIQVISILLLISIKLNKKQTVNIHLYKTHYSII